MSPRLSVRTIVTSVRSLDTRWEIVLNMFGLTRRVERTTVPKKEEFSLYQGHYIESKSYIEGSKDSLASKRAIEGNVKDKNHSRFSRWEERLIKYAGSSQKNVFYWRYTERQK